MNHLIAADTGGTFTDLAVHDTRSGATRFGKALTTCGKDAPSVGERSFLTDGRGR